MAKSGHERMAASARAAEARRDAVAAAVHWLTAAQVAPDPLVRVEALARARAHVEGLFGKAVIAAHEEGRTWRAIGARAGVPWQSLHRRFGRRSPGRKRPGSAHA